MIIKIYKINDDNTYGGTDRLYSDIDIDISNYTAPTGYTFLKPNSPLDVWVVEEWLDPADVTDETIPPTLDELKELKCIAIRDISDAYILQLKYGYSNGETETFEQQYLGAVDIRDNSRLNPDYAMFVQDLLNVRLGRVSQEIELKGFANIIINNYNIAKAYTINIIGTQQYLENLVNQCESIDELSAIPLWLG